MGKAIITANIGDGLYKARPLFDLTRLNAELEKLEAETAEYSATLGRAVLSLSLLEDETEIARRAMNNLIAQWQQDLLHTGNPPEITPPTPDDPDTSLPWDPADKAQEGPLFDAINAARTGAGKAALTRDDDLDFAARRHALDMSGSNLMGHIGSDKSVPSSRVAATLYQADLVVELVACGSLTASGAASEWAINSASSIYSDVATVAGVAYTYSTHHPATHLWVAVLAHPDPSPDPSPPTVTYPDDPAQKAAREQEVGLEKIKPPEAKGLPQPEKLSEAIRKFGIAAGKEAAARRELNRLLAEEDRRNARIDELNAKKTEVESIEYDVWCARYNRSIAEGTIVETVEVPGFFKETTTLTTIELDYTVPNKTVVYQQRSWNVFTGLDRPGMLYPAISMTAADVFFCAAVEPGRLKFYPAWRYGIISGIDYPASTGNVLLNSESARPIYNQEDDLGINAQTSLVSVPISYPPCNASAFKDGDEVLIVFTGLDAENPTVVGFRYGPRPCGSQWSQVV